jgi:uncharacterized protein YbjT (DUF2867 family)
MSEKKIIAVVGATGAQGGGLVRAILGDEGQQFSARALTRHAGSPKAQQLAGGGAEVVEADLDDETSLRKAFDGVHGVYVVTNYFAERTPEQEATRPPAAMELEQAETAARAASDAGVAHVVWSTLEDTRLFFGDSDRVPTLQGHYKVPHFDAKGEADELFRKYAVPTTFLRTAFFYDNFQMQGMGPARYGDSPLMLTIPIADSPMAGIAVEDIGKTALGVFKRGGEFIGETVSIAGDKLTGAQYAAALSEALGEPVIYQPLGWDEYRGLGFPGAVEFGNMFQYYAENSERFTGDRNLALVRELNPQLQSFVDWLTVHKADIHIG